MRDRTDPGQSSGKPSAGGGVKARVGGVATAVAQVG